MDQHPPAAATDDPPDTVLLRADPSAPQPPDDPAAPVPLAPAAPPALSYAKGAPNSAQLRRAAWHLRLTAALMLVTSLLIAWGFFDFFVIEWRPTFVRVPLPTADRFDPVMVPEFNWWGLTRVAPVLTVLLGFALTYWLVASRVARGNRPAMTIAFALALVHALAGALWLLTLLVFGIWQAAAGRAWWETVLSTAMIVASAVMVPWLLWLTVVLLDAGRRRRA